MAQNFKEDLADKYRKAEEGFQDAKKEAARAIENMEARVALEYGAAYASHIDKVTAAAARVMELGQVIRAFQFFNPDEGPVFSESF